MVTIIAGSGGKGSCDGNSASSKFQQLTRICSESKTIFVAEAGGFRKIVHNNLSNYGNKRIAAGYGKAL